jgi:Sec-independent protein translocase protein TatA
MSVNDNFSFVRFLKVVKTLYESSTFTQLGRTVGSALKNNRDEVKQDDDDDTLENRTRSSIDDEDDSRKPSTARTSFLDAITGCTSEQYGRRKESPIQKKENSDGDMDTREKQPYDRAMSKKPNFLEQVMTCTLGTDPGAESDEDTYNVRDGDHSFGAETTTTFETYDDGYDSAPRAYEKGRQH